MDLWILLVVDGQTVEFPPEIYADLRQANSEADHWAWFFSSSGDIQVQRPFDGRLEIGFRDIRIVRVEEQSFDPTVDWWVGVHWTSDGYPDPEAVLLSGREEALEWVAIPPRAGLVPSSIMDSAWCVGASFLERDEPSDSVALRAKVVAAVGPVLRSVVQYEVHLVGTFVQSVRGQLSGAPGLSRAELELLVDRHWGDLSANTEVLLESTWELEGYRELPTTRPE